MTTVFYPPLTALIPVEDLPDELGFVKDGLVTIFGKLYFRDLQFSRSARGDAGFYSLSILTANPIKVEIPGTGIFLVLNPGADGTTAYNSEFPITIAYRWGVLAYLRGFSLHEFSFKPSDFYDLALQILGITEVQLLDRALSVLIDDPNPMSKFVADFNDFYSPTTPLTVPTGSDPLQQLVDDVKAELGEGASVAVFAIYIADNFDPENSKQKMQTLFSVFFGESFETYIKNLISPHFNASLKLGASIEFPTNILHPLDPMGEPYDLSLPANADRRSTFEFNEANFTYDTDGGIGYSYELGGTLSPSHIGKTGLGISILNAKLDISRKKNIVEADLDGRPVDFVGTYIEEAYITLPKKWFKQQNDTTAKIFGRKMIIGTGGISGQIGLEAAGGSSNPALEAKLGNNDGFIIGFQSFDVSLKQNTITGSNIKGYMIIKGFKDASGDDARIDITAHIGEDGEFNVTASEVDGIRVMKIEDILDVRINSLSIGRKDDRFYVAVSGIIDFADQTGKPGGGFIKDNLPKDIEIQKLIVWDDGQIELEGGGIQLRKPITLKLPPVELTITGLHVGSYEQMHGGELRKYKYFGFDGGISVKPGGIDARGDGFKFYFTVDNGPGKPRHVFIRIKSIAIDIIVPGDAKPEKATLLLNGYLSVKRPTNDAEAGAGTEYAGGVTFSLPKLKMAGSAAMRYNPKVPSFLIDIGLEIATPIPLGPTGLGIYGFRALLGQRYVATKKAAGLTEEDKWYRYYKAKIDPDFKEGIQASKFEQKDGFSLGAGVSIATSGDSGKVFSAKVFFLLSLPEVFLIEGQGQILKERIGLNSPNDPPFYAFIAISSSSVETALGVNYKLPEDGNRAGQIVKVDGLIELAFFFGNSSGWYVNLGRDLPEEKRIQARIFDLFNAYFYLMISSAGIRAGAGASFNLEKKFGPFGVKLYAYLDVAGKIAFKPKQIGGSIQLGGGVELKIFWFKFSLSAHVGLAAEAAKPFIVTGLLKVCVRVLRKKRCAKIELTWKKDTNLDTTPIPILDYDNLNNSVKALNIMSKESFNVYAIQAASAPNPNTWPVTDDLIIPLDSYIDIEFKKGINPMGPGPGLDLLGGRTHAAEYTALVAPQKGKSDQVKHSFYVDKLEVKFWNESIGANGGWDDYHIYEAMTALDQSLFPDLLTLNLTDLKQGFWQADHPTRYTKLRMLAQTPFSYLIQGAGDIAPESMNITTGTIFCEDTLREKECILLASLAYKGNQGAYLPANQLVYKDGVIFQLLGEEGTYVYRPFKNFSTALRINEKELLEMFFNEPTACVFLDLQTLAPSLKIHYYKRVDTGQVDANGIVIFDYQLILTKMPSSAQLANTIVYEDATEPVDKVVIEGGCCEMQQEPLVCDTEITPEAAQLEIFFQTLVSNQDLTAPELQLYPKEYTLYNNVFFNTVLYGDPRKNGVKVVDYMTNIASQQLMIVNITDYQGYDCSITFELLRFSPDFFFEKIIKLYNLRPDPAYYAPGPVYHFLIDADVSTSNGVQQFTLAGKACYPIVNCEINGGGNDDPPLPLADIQLMLHTLGDIGKLYQPRDLNITSGSYRKAFDPILNIASLQDAPTEEDLYYESNLRKNGQLEMRIYAKSGYEVILSLLPKESVAGFDYKAVIGVSRTYLGEQLDDTTIAFQTALVAEAEGRQMSIDFIGKASKIAPSTKLKAVQAPMAPIRRSALAPDPNASLECGDLTPEATDLQGFLNRLKELGDFKQATTTLQQPRYDGYFWNTSLYNNQMDVVNYRGTPGPGDKSITISLSDRLGYSCDIKLYLISDVPYTVFDIISFENIRPDPSKLHEGINYDFLIDGLIFVKGSKEPLRVLLGGASCYPIIECTRPCHTFIYQVCYLTLEDFEYNETIPTQIEVQGDNDAMLDALDKLVQPIWRANTYFAIEMITRDDVSVGGNIVNSDVKSFVFGFKTAGGPGYFHNYLNNAHQDTLRSDYTKLIDKNLTDSYKLTDLNHYIDYRKSYPNADGLLINAKPLFHHNPTLGLFYNRQYAFAMIDEWGPYKGAPNVPYLLEAYVKDPTLEEPLALNSLVETNNVPIVSQDTTILNNMMMNGVPCSVVQTVTTIGVHMTFTHLGLEPLKAYTALFILRHTSPDMEEHEREVHRYVFQTSRYADFQEQIHSYRLKDEDGNIQREAIFDVDRTFTSGEITKAQAILLDTLPDTDPLVQEYAHPYDRFLEGALKIGAFHPPTTTEFNILRNGNTILGIWLRNPEPFNDPKLPPSVMVDTLKLTVNGGSNYQVLFSKDNSAAFITNANGSMNMPLGNYEFLFEYILFDGQGYTPVSTINNVQFTIS